MTDVHDRLAALNAAFVEFAAYIPSAFLKEPALRDAIYVNGKRQKSALDAEAKRELKRAKYAKAAAQEPPPSLPAPASTTTEQLSRDELKAKLHAKIESLRTERKANKAQPVSREALIRKSQEQALAAQAEKKRLKKEAKAARKAAAQLAEPSTSKAVAKPPVAVQAPAVQDPAPPAEADLQFSSLDFTAQDTLQPFDTLPGGKAAKRNKAKKDPAAALEKIESRKAFLEKLTPQAQERAQDKDKWAALEARASGAKVLDDEVKLKKMVKRQEKQKQKSKKAWADRTEEAANKQEQRQAKRTENINTRKQRISDKRKGIKAAPPPSKKKTNRGFEKSRGASAADDKKGFKNKGGPPGKGGAEGKQRSKGHDANRKRA